MKNKKYLLLGLGILLALVASYMMMQGPTERVVLSIPVAAAGFLMIILGLKKKR